MRHYLSLLFLFLFFQSKAQLPNYDLERTPKTIRYDQINIPAKLDTTYYPFYDGVQMIKIATPLDSYYKPTFLKTDEFYDVSLIFPIYIFRDEKGNVFKKYNLCGRELEYSKLRKVAAIEKYETHDFRYKLTQSHEQKRWGKLGVYPIYNSKENGAEFEIYCGLTDTLGNVLLEPNYEHIEWLDSIYLTRKDGKYGIVNEKYQKVTENIFDEFIFEKSQRNILIVKRDGNYGLINKKGEYLIPTQYSAIQKSKYRHGYYELYYGGKYQFYNPFNNYLSPVKFSTNNVRWRDNQLLVYDNGWIMMDTNGNVLCKSENEITEMVNENRFLTMQYKDGYHRHIVDKNGKLVNEKEYYYLNKINPTTLLGAYDVKPDNYLTYGRPSKYVFLDANGDMKSDYVYDGFEKLNDDYFHVSRNKKSEIVNDRGQKVFFLEYESVGKMNENYFIVRNKKKNRFLSLKKGEVKYSEEYDETLGMSDGMLGFKKEDKWGYLDSNFTQVGPAIFEKASRYSEGMAEVVLNGKSYVINKKGDNLAREKYESHQKLTDGFIKVSTEGKYGMINENGMLKVPVEYDQLSDLIKGKENYFIIAKKDNYFGIINEKNEIIHPFIYQTAAELGVHVSPEFNRSKGFYAFCTIEKRNHWEYYYFNFDDSKSYMKTGENSTKGFKKIANINCENCSGRKFGIKNWEGETVVPIQYDYINEFKNFTYQVGITGKGGGLIDTTGKILIPIGYKYLYDVGYGSNLIRVGRHHGPWGLYDYSGKMIADTLYGHFEKPIFDLIPFHANYNYHFVEGKGWQNGPKRMGLMDRNGKIILEAHYDDIMIHNEKKGEIYIKRGQDAAILDRDGQLKEGKLYSGKEEEYIPPVTKPKTKRQLRREKRKNKKSKHKVRYL